MTTAATAQRQACVLVTLSKPITLQICWAVSAQEQRHGKTAERITELATDRLFLRDVKPLANGHTTATCVGCIPREAEGGNVHKLEAFGGEQEITLRNENVIAIAPASL